MTGKRFRIAIIVMVMLKTGLCTGQEFDMGGWGLGDPYNQYYDMAGIEKIKATVAGIKEAPPMPGMSPGIILAVETGGRMLDVHVCPVWFSGDYNIRFRKGDGVRIKGCRATINGKTIFMAGKIKKKNYRVFKLRLTKNGQPFWTMTPEDLVEEMTAED